MKIIHLLYSSLLIFFLSSCSGNEELTTFYKFKDQTWPRFNILHLEIPVDAHHKSYDVSLFISHTREYEFDALDFNILMTTPSGEERIKEYHMNIKKKDGGFIGPCAKDSCEVSINLKRQLMLTKGILTIEIENLVPRLEVKGLLSIGIRLRPA
jgi:gliding motility-associated lipoprotein GldH